MQFLSSKKFALGVMIVAALLILLGLRPTFYNGLNKGVVWGNDCGYNVGIEYQEGSIALFWNNCD